MAQGPGTPVAFVMVAHRDRALAFYCDVLGLALKSSDTFGDFLDMGGGLLRMTAGSNHQPSSHPVLGWHVEDIAASVLELKRQGVEFLIYEGFGQDALGIWTAPDGVSKVAFFADPDGNVLTLSQG